MSKHKTQSQAAESTDPGVIGAQHWNESHVLEDHDTYVMLMGRIEVDGGVIYATLRGGSTPTFTGTGEIRTQLDPVPAGLLQEGKKLTPVPLISVVSGLPHDWYMTQSTTENGSGDVTLILEFRDSGGVLTNPSFVDLTVLVIGYPDSAN